jgi:Uma2 family endonuclease
MAPLARPATPAELLARPDRDRLELVGGELVQKAAPTAEHGRGQGATIKSLGRRFDRKPGGRWPGGWWFATETHVHYPSGVVFCHDLVGWRRDRVPEFPTGFAVRVRPDWVCEVLSPRNEKRDFVDKPRALHAAEVPHYWILDAQERLLIVHRWSPDGYTMVLSAGADETVRAEPFGAVELRVAVLFGDDDDDE